MPTEDDVAIPFSVKEKLRNKLLQGYSKDRRPAADHKTPFAVAVSMSLTQFDLVIILEHLMIISAKIRNAVGHDVITFL